MASQSGRRWGFHGGSTWATQRVPWPEALHVSPERATHVAREVVKQQCGTQENRAARDVDYLLRRAGPAHVWHPPGFDVVPAGFQSCFSSVLGVHWAPVTSLILQDSELRDFFKFQSTLGL